MREEEVVGRYGGEEFLMVMPDMEKRNALKAAERIRRLVAKHKFPFGEKQPLERITVSGGVAHYPTDAQDAEELLRHADQALYRAKGEGRNRVLAHVLPDLPSSDFCDPFVREVLDDLPEELLVEQVKEN
jgi:diguanylate cyclase (GGDEF)-like protein